MMDFVLTPRELEVVEHVARSHINREIGRAMGISEGTVKTYLVRIFRKLHMSNRVQLAIWANNGRGTNEFSVGNTCDR